jgi:hypothetical protein
MWTESETPSTEFGVPAAVTLESTVSWIVTPETAGHVFLRNSYRYNTEDRTPLICSFHAFSIKLNKRSINDSQYVELLSLY